MNVKITAIAVVLVVVVAGCAAYLLMNNDNDDSYRSTDTTGRLAIMGNANNDDYLDNEDLSTIDAIIDGTVSATDYPMADANNDGKVDSADREMVQKMINRESMTINYINGNDEIKSVMYPVNRVVVVGTNVALTLKAVGAVASGKVVGTTGESSKDYYLFSEFKDLPKVSDSTFKADYDAVSKISNVDAIVTMSTPSYITNESTFTNAGISVIRMASSDGMKSTSVALTMGYLLNLEDRANDYAKFCDKVLSYISEKKDTIPESSVKTCLAATMSNYVCGTASDYYELTVMVGGKNLADWSTMTQRFKSGDEWLLNDKYHAEAFIHYHGYSYDPSEDQTTMYKTYRGYFEATQTVKDGNYCLINSNMPAIVRLAYTASVLYPEIFGADYGDKIHQEYIDNYIDNLSKAGYKVTDMKFVLTDSDFGITS